MSPSQDDLDSPASPKEKNTVQPETPRHWTWHWFSKLSLFLHIVKFIILGVAWIMIFTREDDIPAFMGYMFTALMAYEWIVSDQSVENGNGEAVKRVQSRTEVPSANNGKRGEAIEEDGEVFLQPIGREINGRGFLMWILTTAHFQKQLHTEEKNEETRRSSSMAMVSSLLVRIAFASCASFTSAVDVITATAVDVIAAAASAVDVITEHFDADCDSCFWRSSPSVQLKTSIPGSSLGSESLAMSFSASTRNDSRWNCAVSFA
ncbi:unnamed protein product [Cyprideis torosa]|uniref:Uncharacterized protein n=1 Tax=Cyprideis torosa TaxID=163714 RepID=A0A7R8ZP60_9CRUS|nr:unnamed protein product [Cyprideis torosa]CAG0893156.1 unnamed protein product [Cyprideis torosa]